MPGEEDRSATPDAENESRSSPRSLRALRGIGPLRSMERGAQLVKVAAEVGLGDVLSRMGIGVEKDGDGRASREPLARRVRLALERLGPTFIKCGQILSTRPDLLPEDWIKEFSRLQASVPPAPWDGEDGVRAVLESEFEGRVDEIFESIDHEAMAAASMAQVHRATLRDGGDVILKVLRPHVDSTIEADLDLMRWIARLAGKHLDELGFDPVRVVEEFAKQLARETDLTIEATSTERMGNDFPPDGDVRFARIFRQASTKRVLAQERVQGTILADLDASELSEERRTEIVRRAADMVFRQCLEIGFFHADPHPGNIFVLEHDRLCFIDCGMTGLIAPHTMTQLAELVHGALEGDLDKVVILAVQISGADPAIGHERAFQSDVWAFIDRFKGGSLASIKMGELLSEFFTVLRRHRMSCPADIVYLIKALTTIEGVAEELAPDFDVVGYVRPYVERLIKQRYSPEALKKRLLDTTLAYSEMLERLPRRLEELAATLQRGDLTLRHDVRDLDRLNRTLDRASHNIGWAIVVSAILVGSSVVLLAGSVGTERTLMLWLGGGGFAVALALALWRIALSIIRRP